MFRRPSLTLAEVAWRWSFWAAGAFLLSALLIEYLDTLPVGPRDLFFLNSGQPTLIGRALSHIFQGSSVRLLLGGIVAVSGLSIAWTLIAALGRSASLGAIREYFSHLSESSPAEFNERPTPHRRALGSLAGLNFLRLTVGLAASIAFVGAFVLPRYLSTPKSPKPALAFVLTLVLLSFVCVAWLLVNWTLSLSAVFAVRDRKDSFGALAAATRFSRERAGGLWAINFWFGLAHLTLFFVGTTAASMVLGMVQVLPGVLVLTALGLLALLYFVAADSVNVGRMAAWYCLADSPVYIAPPPLPPAKGFDSNQIAIQFPPDDDILIEVETRQKLQPSDPAADA